MPEYRIYIDEVGNPDLSSSDDPNHRFLSLTGVIIGLDDVQTVVQPRMEWLKTTYFPAHHPDEPVIFHRKEMMNAINPFHILKDINVRERFNNDLLIFLSEMQYTVITVCIDKQKHREKYLVWRHDPYHYCMMVILERYAFFLKRHQTTGDVMSETRGGKEDLRLKDSFERIWERGTTQVDAVSFQQTLSSRQLKIRGKANNIVGLQLADLLAHPSRNEILRKAGYTSTVVAPFAEQIIAILQQKYDQRDGRVFGRKLLP